LTALAETKDLSTLQGLTGLTKCTYIVTVAAEKGAPAFKLKDANYFEFQFHYVEWANIDMTYMISAP
jgi:hypothetical protein